MTSVSYNAWTKIDDGSDGVWAADIWLGVVKIVAKHEGERVYDPNSPIYSELETKLPGFKWQDKADGFRPYFRDFSKPWTVTGAITFNDTFQLTSLGRELASGVKTPRDAMIEFCERYKENEEYPFRILSSGFLELDKPLTLEEIFQAIELRYRPGKERAVDSLHAAQPYLADELPATPRRRLIVMLKILERTGAISSGKAMWSIWDKAILMRLAESHNGAADIPESSLTVAGIDGAFLKDAQAANLSLPAPLPRNVISSLLAKPFLILTGLSGSGKTKVAHSLAEWICESPDQYRLVAVGADWTSNENILGYQDALQPGKYCKPTSGSLDLILAASANPARPYFLILDEMNLSHVERYFSDILSVIESRGDISLHASAGALNTGPGDTPVPPIIKFPTNLFIIGTVNVDETTYMFSPKVLDRANVIEFRASPDDMSSFLNDPKSIDLAKLRGRGVPFAQAFVRSSTLQTLLSELDETITGGVNVQALLNSKLVQIFHELALIGSEFGFRTGIEISRFTYFHAFLSGEGWKLADALDAQVLQKLLPKLHGSERRLGPVLKKLSEFCTENGCEHSLKKIVRMQERLKDGFTSFAEA